MADEPIVEPSVPVETVAEPVIPNEKPEVTTEPAALVDETTSEESEPGGSSPQEIRARKEYRARKRAEQQLDTERFERVRLEERLRAQEEVRQQQPVAQPEREYTADEVQTAIDAGKVTVAQAAEYFAEVKAKRLQQQAAQAATALKPFQRASSEVDEYMAHLPWTRDRLSLEFQDVAKVYQSLVNDYGFANDIRTQRVALERVAGSLEKIKQRAQVASTTRQARVDSAHAETAADGSAPARTSDINTAPETMQRMWKKTNTSQADRAIEFKHWQERQKA